MASATLTFTVTEADTAEALGSGDLPVLATPRLLAWCEAATCAAVAAELDDPGQTTVGTSISLDHVAATGLRAEVRVRAEVVRREGRTVRFAVAAHDGPGFGRLIGHGEVVRAVVQRDRFLARIRR